jgi:hypothetical protein
MNAIDISFTNIQPHHRQEWLSSGVDTEIIALDECKAVANAEDISESQLKKLQDKKAKTKIERYQERKALLRERYGVEVTSFLVCKDDEGWYPQLRLHYFLTIGREQLPQRDAATAKVQIEVGENAIWKPDFNLALLLATVLMLEDMNIRYFLTPGVMFRGSDAATLKLKEVAILLRSHFVNANRHIIKNYLGISVSEGMSLMAIVQTLLDKFGLNLSYVGRLGSRWNGSGCMNSSNPKMDAMRFLPNG